MSQSKKLLQRLRDRIFTGWTFGDLERVLLHVGFAPVSSEGSHRTFKHVRHPKLFTLRDGPGELPTGYARDLLRRIEDIEKLT